MRAMWSDRLVDMAVVKRRGVGQARLRGGQVRRADADRRPGVGQHRLRCNGTRSRFKCVAVMTSDVVLEGRCAWQWRCVRLRWMQQTQERGRDAEQSAGALQCSTPMRLTASTTRTDVGLHRLSCKGVGRVCGHGVERRGVGRHRRRLRTSNLFVRNYTGRRV